MSRLPKPDFFGLPNLAEIVRNVTRKTREDSMILALEIIKIMIQGLKDDGEIRFKNFCTVHIVDIEPGKILICGEIKNKQTRKVKAFFSRAFRKEIA